jgi:hypothetical protein
MEGKMKKHFVFAMVSLLIAVSVGGCATMIRTKSVNVSAASGATNAVRVFENGMPIYEGNLPASFPVKARNTYTVLYTASDNQERVVSIDSKFNSWFIGSVFLGFLPAIVDLVTGNIMRFEKSTVLPISYSPVIILTDFVAEEAPVEIIGNIYNME